MRSSFFTLFFCIILSGCAHRPCQTLGSLLGCSCVKKIAQPEYQDMSVQIPIFDSTLKLDVDLDGYTLQAIRVAADDFLDADPTGLPCAYKQVSHKYQAVRKGDIIFVRIDFKPENCGRTLGLLDAGVTYAIDVYGHILRREADGSGPF